MIFKIKRHQYFIIILSTNTFPSSLHVVNHPAQSTLHHFSCGQHKSPVEVSTSIQTHLPIVPATPKSSYKIIILIFESPSTVQYFSHGQR